MAENFREPFFNPYVDGESEEARFSTFVTMDEAHERWNNGTWRGNKTDFELDPSMFAGDRGLKLDQNGKGSDEPKENRFAFDLQKDIVNADQLTSRLDENAYTGNYRPVGTIGSTLSNLTIDRLKYNALADIKEELPDDLSYLYGESDSSRFKMREVKLRSYSRLDTPVDKRRAEIEKMLPEENKESPEAIMEDIRRRREIEDAKSGIDSSEKKKYARLGIYDVRRSDGSDQDFYTPDDQYDIEGVTERGSWRGDIPEQDGLVPDSKEQPHFGRFSRRWSKIDQNDPSRNDMLRHTVDTIYDDEQEKKSRFNSSVGGREYYVDDAEFDPSDRYRRMERSRRRISAGKNVLSDSIMSGQFNNPYVQISNKRLRDIINHDLRGPGHVTDPEGLTDPALMYEWNMGYSRVNSSDDNVQQCVDEQRKLADLADTAEQSRYRGSHRTGLPGAYIQREKPYGSERRYPRGEYTEHHRQRRDMQEQLRQAAERGFADGREIVRSEQRAKREAEQEKARRREEERRVIYEQQRLAYERQMKEYRRLQEQMMRGARAQGGVQPSTYAPQQTRNSARRRAPSRQPQNVPPKPQFGPLGFYTPKQPEKVDDSGAGRKPQRRR